MGLLGNAAKQPAENHPEPDRPKQGVDVNSVETHGRSFIGAMGHHPRTPGIDNGAIMPLEPFGQFAVCQVGQVVNDVFGNGLV
jgi:hypothetical protein